MLMEALQVRQPASFLLLFYKKEEKMRPDYDTFSSYARK